MDEKERQRLKEQLPKSYYMERRFENCITVEDAMLKLTNNLGQGGWDIPEWRAAFHAIIKRFGALNIHMLPKIEVPLPQVDELEELKKELQVLKMQKGRVEAQNKKLKEGQ